MGGVGQVILAREELFSPRIESPRILPLSYDNYFECSKPEMITESSPVRKWPLDMEDYIFVDWRRSP